MKIEGTPKTIATDARSRADAQPQKKASAEAEPATRRSLSPDAAFIQSVREEAEQAESVREDVVAEVKQSLRDGSFEGSVDLDDVIDGLLADL